MITHEQAEAIMAEADKLIATTSYGEFQAYIALVDARGGPKSTLAKLIRNSNTPWPTKWDPRTWPSFHQELEIGGRPCGVILFVGRQGGFEVDVAMWVSLQALFAHLINKTLPQQEKHT